MTTRHASSPSSTGGAGVFFEQHVAAYWLAQLLVRAIPPVFVRTQISEAHFQTEHLGWNTDDFLVVCEAPDGTRHKLVGQVKRGLRISATDDDCKKFINDFWTDFKTTHCFSQSTDRFLLVTQRGTATLLKDFVGLLDCARAARTATDFGHRLDTKGLLSAKSVRYCSELCKVVGTIENRPITGPDIWEFLRVIHVRTLDLCTTTCQDEAQVTNLLAHTVADGDPISAARESWNALLALASDGMSNARSFRRGDLPIDLRSRHGPIGTKEHVPLDRLRAHTEPVLRRIRSTIGSDFHLHRNALVQRILGQLEEVQVVLVSGPAGCGKSAVAKDTLSILSPDHFVFAFRVEEFAQPHIDSTLHLAQVSVNVQALQAILAAQDRTVVLIDGVERLLEKTTRDAFSDLMELVKADPSIRVLLTCRAYSVEQVRASFLQPVAFRNEVVAVPVLDDGELAHVEEALPKLVGPLRSKALRSVLRNPYHLDQAFALAWPPEHTTPENEREFRSLVWRQTVRAEAFSSSGMPRRREATLQEIAVRRARSLSDYVLCKNLDPTALDALRHDSLLVSSKGNPSLVAPAHDVIEDWAILHWLEEQHQEAGGDFGELSATIGEHPAIRRSFRKWVSELIDRDPESSDQLFRSALSEIDVRSQFRDDTLVSLLGARAAPEFVRRHENALLADDNALLKRVVHLLRVACVRTPPWHPGVPLYGSVADLPSGQMWSVILCLADRHIEALGATERPLLLGLIEHATRDPDMWTSDVAGGACIASIAHWLLRNSGGYENVKSRRRVLKVLARIPMADPDGFARLLRGAGADATHRDRIADDLCTLLFTTMDGWRVAQSLPELVMEVAKRHLLAEKEAIVEGRCPGLREIDICFGVSPRLHHEFFPPSAHKGPWLALLHSRSRRGLDFFIHVFNYSIRWYVRYRPLERLEPASEVELTFADGETRTQWGNARLWNLYRGTSVGPNVLQSLLMALEKWLLDLANEKADEIDGVLVDLLRRSESAAVAAVVSSVATAHPNASGETLLVLLSAPEYILLDRGRLGHEHQASNLPGYFGHISIEHRLHAEERREANRATHRQQDLQLAILKLHVGRFSPRVRAALDAYLAALDSKSEHTETEQLWRLAVHRMDLRHYAVAETDGAMQAAEGGENDPNKEMAVILEPRALPPDLQARVDRESAKLADRTRGLGPLIWGLEVFERRPGTHDPAQWREQLELARSIDRSEGHWYGPQNCAASVAAVCCRDHWDELTKDEHAWCLDAVCQEVEWDSAEWDRVERMGMNPLSAAKFCAAVLPLLLHRELSDQQNERVRIAFASAITHPVEDVRSYVVGSLGEDFWAADARVAMRCVNAFATEAGLLGKAWQIEEKRPYEAQTAADTISAEAARTIRDSFWRNGSVDNEAWKKLDCSEQFGALALVPILRILGHATQSPIAVALCSKASEALVEWWDKDDDRGWGRRPDFSTEAGIRENIQEFVMGTSRTAAMRVLTPLLDAIDRHPREIAEFVRGLTIVEDRNPRTETYWFLWEQFANRVRGAVWISNLKGQHPVGREMLTAVFLTSGWKDEVRHWKSLEGHANRVHRLYDDLAPSAIVLDDYVRFLFHIGEQSLPYAFVRLADSISKGDGRSMLASEDTVFLLEVLLQRRVYGRPSELKRDARMRAAVLVLLDALIDSGSSAAFRMRDDFVTPRT